MNNNKKAQSTTVGHILIVVMLFGLLLISGFSFYFGSLSDNNVALPDGINKSEFDAAFARYDDDLTQTASTVDSSKGEAPTSGGLIDFFASGIDSIKAGWQSVGFVKDYTNFARKNTKLGEFLPDSFWTMLGAILTIILVFIVIGALWRYSLTK